MNKHHAKNILSILENLWKALQPFIYPQEMIHKLAYSNRYNVAALHRQQAKADREFVNHEILGQAIYASYLQLLYSTYLQKISFA